MTIRFKLKKKKYIYIIVSYRGGEIDVSTGLTVDPEHWDTVNHRVKKTSVKGKAINAIINRLKIELDALYTSALSKGQIDNIRDTLIGATNEITGKSQSKNTPDLLEYLDIISAEKRYRVEANRLKQFAKDQNKGKLDYHNINWEFLAKYEAWCYQQRNYSKNTVAKTISIVKYILKQSHRLGYHTNEIFRERDFSVKNERVKNKPKFSLEEVDRLFHFEVKKKKLQKIKDLAIVGVYTGLRISDWHKVTKDNIFYDKDGDAFIKIMAQKTKNHISIPVLPELQYVLDKYDYKLPFVSDWTFRRSFKQLCQVVFPDLQYLRIYSEGGETKSETTNVFERAAAHTLRRTFVSIFLELGVSPELIRQITGHSTQKQMYEYADVDSQALAKQFMIKAKESMEERRKKIKRI